MSENKLSLLFPYGEDTFKLLPETSIHDLGIDFICEKLSEKREEQDLFKTLLSRMSDDSRNTEYRCAVFEDIYNNPEMCDNLMKVLGQIDYEKQYSGFSGHYEETDSAWELLHRLEEINNYIVSVEAMYKYLSEVELKSEGLNKLKDYISKTFEDNGFAELKKDIKELKTSTTNIKSITVGINLNEKYEAHGIGLLSFNKKQFTKSTVLNEFIAKVSPKDSIQEEAEWDKSYKYHELTSEAMDGDFFDKFVTISRIIDPRTENVTFYMDKIANLLIGNICRKLKMVLKKYVYIAITDVTMLIPEFIFYIRFANYIKSMKDMGFKFCRAKIAGDSKEKAYMDAKGIYNFKLLSAFAETSGPDGIITNDLSFSSNQLAYILTGANRGGKTTITQAIGLLFVLAQAGIFIPGESFEFNPVDGIYTHFPADEDKTMDLGRLGEECKRFKELFVQCSDSSLLLLNETYSTTSFEEGYYIAKDSVKAILSKGIRTIYNTHMHKLAYDISEINQDFTNKAASLVVKAENGQRSFKVEVAPPEGNSFANDIAKKYGVTYEMLINEDLTGEK